MESRLPFGRTLRGEISPETTCLQCPDCGHPCPVAFTLLTTRGKTADLTACPNCADRITIRHFRDIDAGTFAEAARLGLPVVDYGRQK